MTEIRKWRKVMKSLAMVSLVPTGRGIPSDPDEDDAGELPTSLKLAQKQPGGN